MAGQIRGFDHVLVAASDLDGAAQRWRDLGFTLTPRGRHVGKTTANHCIMFADDYVELIGIVEPCATPSQHHPLIAARGDGLFGAALAPGTAAAARLAVLDAGIEAEQLRALRRSVLRPDGEAELRFENFDLPPAAWPDFLLFFCQHLTPSAMRHPDWLAHSNGATGLAGITVVCADPSALYERCTRLFGAGALVLTGDALTVHLGRHRLLFLSPADFDAIYAYTPQEPPFGAVISFEVEDLEVARAALQRSGLALDRDSDALLVQPDGRGGTVLEFQRRRPRP